MSRYLLEISDYIKAMLEEGAKIVEMDIETFIAEILNRYAIDPHIMEGDDIARAYVDMGEINIKEIL